MVSFSVREQLIDARIGWRTAMITLQGQGGLSSGSAAAFVILLLLIYSAHGYVKRNRVALNGLPWVGLRNESFAKTRAHWREWFNSRVNIKLGYHLYSKRSKPFVTPNITRDPVVMLPPAHIKWLVDQPEEVLSIHEVLIEDVQFNFTSPRSWKFSRPFHVEALNKMQLDLMTPVIVEEIERCMSRLFEPNTTQWMKFPLHSSMWAIISQITNRAFVGLPVAHNENYIWYSHAFIQSIIRQSTMITLFIPLLLRPILGHLLALPCRYYDYRCSRYLVPVIQQHLKAAVTSTNLNEIRAERSPDMLQLMARFAAKSSDPLDHDPRSLCSRILALCFVGIHTSSLSAINAFLDIAAAGQDVYQKLRAEASEVLRENGGTWSKAAVNRLVLLDSCIRESLRFSAFKARGVERRVVAFNGVTLPDGTFLPSRTKIGMPTAEIHKDPAFYDRPEEFISDRFIGYAELGMVNTTGSFLAFGHGRHACPGRFFSSYELKLLFAHIVLNYDIRFLAERPTGTYVSDFCIPPDVAIEMKKRNRSAYHLDH